MDAYRAVVDKRDQRRAFLDKPIADEALRRILQAGRMTGSSKNREPNRFMVVRDRACLAAVAALDPMARLVARPPWPWSSCRPSGTSSTPVAAPRT